MSNHKDDESLARWDAYWRHGYLTSCADAFDGNYGGRIAKFWQREFAPLPDDAAILDICTGNGAVAALAATEALSRGRHFRIDAIDLAAIAPSLALADEPGLLNSIEFHPRTSATDLPFQPDSFDLACGQYALEYTPLADAVAELARVVKPGGRAVFVLHHRQSVILETTREEISHAELLSGDSALYSSAEALCRRVAAAGTPAQRQALAGDPQAEKARNKLNASAAAISERAQDSPHPELLVTALGHVQQAYKAVGSDGLSRALELLEQGRQAIAANLARLDDLNGAALDDQAMADLNDCFVGHGFNAPVTGQLDHDKHLIGWTLTTTLPV